MTTAKELVDEASRRAGDAWVFERNALATETAMAFVAHAQASQRSWVCALISLLRFVDAIPEPVTVPPVPQPSEEARRRGLLVGAIVRDHDGNLGRIVSHGLTTGRPLVQWRVNQGICEETLTVIRPAPLAREPNAKAVKRGLYIGALVANIGANCRGEVIAWDRYGNPVVLGREGYAVSWSSEYVTLDGDAS